MVNKVVLLVLALAVAAVEGRARGAKLGHSRDTRQFWNNRPFIRQETPAPGSPQPVAGTGFPSTPGAQPAPQQGGSPAGGGLQQPNQGGNPQPGAAIAPAVGGFQQPALGGYQQPGAAVTPAGGGFQQPAPGGYQQPGAAVAPAAGGYQQPAPVGYQQPGAAVAPAGGAYQQPAPGGYQQPGAVVAPAAGGFQQPAPGGYQQPGAVAAPAASGYQQPASQSAGYTAPGQQGTLCKYPGFFATPGTCRNFYRCVDQSNSGVYTIFHFQCGPGTVFNEKISVCDYPSSRPECSGGSVPLAGGSGGYSQPGAGQMQPCSATGTQGEAVVSPGSSYPQPGDGKNPTTGVTGEPTDPSVLFQLKCDPSGKYFRHPLYCNRYYRCQKEKEGDDYDFPKLTCPEGLLFDDATQKCAEPSETGKCEGKLAPHPQAETEATDAMETTTMTIEGEYPVDEQSQYQCPAEGYYPFEHDCVRFYKCRLTDEKTLVGYRYKCPEGYGYSDELQRCDKEDRLPPCDKAPLPASLRGSFPSIELTVQELRWFFDY